MYLFSWALNGDLRNILYNISDQKARKPMCDQNLPQGEGMPILHYPDIRGIVQPIRHLFYYLDKNFGEINNINIRELEAGFNSGYPKLVQDDFQLTDAIAIFRHLCRYYQRNDLLGLTPQNRAMINEFLFHYTEVRVKVIKKISEGAKNAWGKQNEGEIYEIKLNVAKVIVQDECKILKEFLQMHMKNKGWIMSNLTIADFFFYEICFYIVNFLGSSLKNSLIYRNFENFVNMFESQDFFKANIDKIKNKKIFMPFKDKETSQIMASFWQGDKLLIA